MSYNNCCDPCQGYYEPYQYYEPYLYYDEHGILREDYGLWDKIKKGASKVLPKFDLKSLFEKYVLTPLLASDMVTKYVQDFLSEQKNDYFEYKKETDLTGNVTGTVILHYGKLDDKLKAFLGVKVLGLCQKLPSFPGRDDLCQSAKTYFDQFWEGTIAPKFWKYLGGLAESNAQSLINILKTKLPPQDIINNVRVERFEYEEDYSMLGDMAKKAAKKALEYAKNELKSYLKKEINSFIESERAKCATSKDGCAFDIKEDGTVVVHKGALHLVLTKFIEDKASPLVKKGWKAFGEKGTEFALEFIKNNQAMVLNALKARGLNVKGIEVEKYELFEAYELAYTEPYQYYDYEPYVYNNYCNC